jgi:nucleoside-diphosphate-sugar epimerase
MACFLVTGSAGFIGARVAEMLIEQGHAVTGVDNLNDAYDILQNHPSHQTDILANRAEISKARLLSDWEPLMSMVDGMRHFVGWYRSERDWAEEGATP